MEPELTDRYLVYAYQELKHSTYTLAQFFQTYPNKIRRKLLDMGVKLRDKSEAQKTALETGRHVHPTLGRKRTESEKIKISEGVARVWEDMTLEEKESRSQMAKDNWEAMTFDERQNLKKKAGAAVRESAEHGSKLERYLLFELRRNGYQVEFHRENLVNNEKLQMDLFLPELEPPIVIEIDGPAHFFPIWGEESLVKHLNSDRLKNGLLLEAGYIVIRIKHLVKNLSEIHKRRVLTSLLEVLQSIERTLPAEDKRLIEIEVK